MPNLVEFSESYGCVILGTPFVAKQKMCSKINFAILMQDSGESCKALQYKEYPFESGSSCAEIHVKLVKNVRFNSVVNSRYCISFRISCKTYSSVSLEGGLGYFVFEGSYSLLVLWSLTFGFQKRPIHVQQGIQTQTCMTLKTKTCIH